MLARCSCAGSNDAKMGSAASSPAAAAAWDVLLPLCGSLKLPLPWPGRSTQLALLSKGFKMICDQCQVQLTITRFRYPLEKQHSCKLLPLWP